MDNDNLQDLFPEEQMKRMQLKNGGVTFHSNHKLCLHKIKRFVKYLNLTQPPSEKDIGENGSLMPCTCIVLVMLTASKNNSCYLLLLL